jgi:hypothetical protein
MQTKPAAEKAVDVRHIKWQAKQFIDAALKCLPPDLPNGVWEGPVGPGVVCAAFGVELWFKVLHFIAYPNKRLPREHDLLKLFKLLPVHLREQLANRCSNTHAEFESALGINAAVFVSWRYAYEHGMGSTGLIEALEADVRQLLELASASEALYVDYAPPHKSKSNTP